MSWNFTFSSSSDLACVEVAITDDSISELVETFTVTIQPTGPSRLISVQPSEITININNDDGTTVAGTFFLHFDFHFHRCTSTTLSSFYPSAPQLVVDIVGSPSGTTTTIQEDDGILNELVQILSSGAHPLPLHYQVSVTPSSKPLVYYSYIQYCVVYAL